MAHLRIFICRLLYAGNPVKAYLLIYSRNPICMQGYVIVHFYSRIYTTAYVILYCLT